MTVLFIPGFAGHGAEFTAQIDRLTEPALTTDLPDTSDATIERQADRLAALADARGLGDLLIVGHSQDGIVALALAERRPDLVRGLVLLDAPVLVPAPVRTVLRVLLPALICGGGCWSSALRWLTGLDSWFAGRADGGCCPGWNGPQRRGGWDRGNARGGFLSDGFAIEAGGGGLVILSRSSWSAARVWCTRTPWLIWVRGPQRIRRHDD